MLKQRAGLDMLHVPYRGGAPALQDMLAGQVDMDVRQHPGPLPQYKAGKLRGLAVTSRERSPVAPELPPMTEFYPGFEITSWGGLCGPAGLPPAMVEKAVGAVQEGAGERGAEDRLPRPGRDGVVDEPGRCRRVPPQRGAEAGADHHRLRREGELKKNSAEDFFGAGRRNGRRRSAAFGAESRPTTGARSARHDLSMSSSESRATRAAALALNSDARERTLVHDRRARRIKQRRGRETAALEKNG